MLILNLGVCQCPMVTRYQIATRDRVADIFVEIWPFPDSISFGLCVAFTIVLLGLFSTIV